MNYLICIFIGYLFGCFNLAFILGKINGFDIREKGSKNAGASNTAVTMGFKNAILVALCDIFKAFAAAYVCGKIFPDFALAPTIAAVSAIIGHMFPFWMGFRGGKGLASFLGMILASNWKMFIVFCLLVILITIITDYIALATITTAIAYPVSILIMTSKIAVPCIIAVATAAMLYKHSVNIKRIIKGEEIGLRKVAPKAK